MEMIQYQDNPRYERIIAKIAAMRPEQRAIFDTAMADKAFAGEAMQRHLRGFVDAADARNKSRSLDLRERGLNLQTGLANQAMDYSRKQNRIGNVIGAAAIPISGFFGYKQMKRDIAEADANRSLRELVRQKYGV